MLKRIVRLVTPHLVNLPTRPVLLFLLALAPGVSAAELADVIEQLRGGIVGVGSVYPPRQPIPKGKNRLTFSGTGFVIGNGLTVITNAHVVPKDIDTKRKEVMAVFSGSGAQARAHPARVLRLDRETDLAVLGFEPPGLTALTLGDSRSVREGQDIAVTGFPLGTALGMFPVTHRGIVSSIVPVAQPAESARALNPARMRAARNKAMTFQLDVVAYPGNSGSPVYDPGSGRVLGVVNSVMVKESRESLLSQPTGITYAIPVQSVRQLLRDASIDE